MAEQVDLDPSLETILHLICDGVMEEKYEFSDHPSPFEPINPGSQIEIVEVDKMLLLLEVNFDSREDLVAVVHKITLMEGYVTVIKRSKPEKCVFIGCDRGGKYRDTRMVPLEKRKRKTSSRGGHNARTCALRKDNATMPSFGPTTSA